MVSEKKEPVKEPAMFLMDTALTFHQPHAQVAWEETLIICEAHVHPCLYRLDVLGMSGVSP